MTTRDVRATLVGEFGPLALSPRFFYYENYVHIHDGSLDEVTMYDLHFRTEDNTVVRVGWFPDEKVMKDFVTAIEESR